MRPLALTAAALLCTAGCSTTQNFINNLTGRNQPQQVTPDQFLQQQVADTTVDNPHSPPQLPPGQPPAAPAARPPIDKAVAAATEPPAPTTQPAPQIQGPQPAPDATLASGQYLPLGGVVAEVNGTPIYINKVLQLVWPILHNDARSMDADHFMLAARDVINKQIDDEESAELVYAAAERALDENDKKLAADLTTAYHQQLITEAGGSLEVARRKAAANGDDFDQVIRDQYRYYMRQLYQQRKFSSLAEPTAQDLRTFYKQHINDPFITEHSEAVFDLIQIDPAQLHSDSAAHDRQLAFDQAKQAHDRAAAGGDFPTIFAEYNNDPHLRIATNNTGNMGSIQRGSFYLKEVEDAVWKLEPNQVTDVLEINGLLYIAKMESRKQGVVRPFEDEVVQERIAAVMRQERFRHFYEEERARLLSEAVTTTYDDMFHTAIDMAMQSYKVWSAH